MVAVAIERKGCFHFQLMGPESWMVTRDYVEEKLSLPGEDAEHMAKLLNLTHAVLTGASVKGMV